VAVFDYGHQVLTVGLAPRFANGSAGEPLLPSLAADPCH